MTTRRGRTNLSDCVSVNSAVGQQQDTYYKSEIPRRRPELLNIFNVVAHRCAGIPGVSEILTMYDVVVCRRIPSDIGVQVPQRPETPVNDGGVAWQLWQDHQFACNRRATDKTGNPAIPAISERMNAINAQQERNGGEMLLRAPPRGGRATSPATTAQENEGPRPPKFVGMRGGVLLKETRTNMAITIVAGLRELRLKAIGRGLDALLEALAEHRRNPPPCERWVRDLADPEGDGGWTPGLGGVSFSTSTSTSTTMALSQRVSAK
jgi:hypothetical protein